MEISPQAPEFFLKIIFLISLYSTCQYAFQRALDHFPNFIQTEIRAIFVLWKSTHMCTPKSSHSYPGTLDIHGLVHCKKSARII